MKITPFLIGIISILSLGVSYAQYSIPLSDVGLIVYNKEAEEIRLFKEKPKGIFTEIYLYFDENHDDNTVSLEIEYDKVSSTRDKIELEKKDVVLRTSDLKDTPFRKLLNTKYKISGNWKENRFRTDTSTLVLHFLNHSLSSIKELYLGEKEENVSFGAVVEEKDKNAKKWRVYSAEYYTIIDLDLGQNKHIYLLNDGEYSEFCFIPLKSKNILLSSEGISDLEKTSAYPLSYFDHFQKLDVEDFTSTLKTKNNKYILVNLFKENLLKNEYDTIETNQFFTIAKNGDQIDIFNSYYEKLNFKNVKSAYLYRSGLEILNDKGANYYDTDLKIIDEFPPLSYYLCGTVPETSYEIIFQTLLVKTYGGMASNLHKSRSYYLEGLKQKDKITFLNNSITYSWDGNDDFTNRNYAYPQFLKIQRKNKSGIFEYDYHDYSSSIDTIQKDWYKKVIFDEVYIDKEIVLPINNDSIVFNEKDGLIYFYRKKKVGIFPRRKKVQYRNISQKTQSFYSITRKRKKGWLDIKTNKEYF